MSQKTLFLDFDGVLHPSISTNFFSNKFILEEVIQKFSLQIVISSSWRFSNSLSTLKNLLGTDLSSKVIGPTGEAFIGKFARYKEIISWVEIHGCDDWLILDDSKFEFPVGLKNLMLCDSRVGITSEIALKIQGWLEEPKSFHTIPNEHLCASRPS